MTPRLVVVGFGQHGRQIAADYARQGGHVPGAADPALAGRLIGEVIGDASFPDIAIVSDAGQLLAAEPDIALITAPVDLEGLAEIAIPFLDAGVDVLTIHPDAFDPPTAWAERIDSHARKGNARFLSTGVQDVWWVHVPAAAAGATSALRRVVVSHATDLNTLSADLGRLFGLGQQPDAFDQVRDVILSEQSVLGGPLRVLARRLGLTPGDARRDLQAVVAEVSMPWPTGGRDIEPGQLAGFIETVTITTEEGVAFVGELRTALLMAGEEPSDRVLIEGDPVLHLEHRPFPGRRITDIVPLNRIWTIHEAAPGLHTAASLPPARYRHMPDTKR